MNRLEFMKELEMRLSDITQSEREEAIQYYNDYLNDAGVENEQEVLDSLGTPQDLAKVIKEGLNDNGESGEFTETGYKNEAFGDGLKNEVARKEQAAGKQTDQGQFYKKEETNKEASDKESSKKGTGWSTWSAEKKSGNQGGWQPEKSKQERKPLSPGMIILIIILCIVAFPVLVGIAATVLGTGVGILGSIFGLVIGIAAAGIGLMVAAVIMIVFGIAALVTAPLAGICFLGLGILLAGFALFFLCLTVWIFGKVIPWIIRGVVKVCSRIFHRREERNV